MIVEWILSDHVRESSSKLTVQDPYTNKWKCALGKCKLQLDMAEFLT